MSDFSSGTGFRSAYRFPGAPQEAADGILEGVILQGIDHRTQKRLQALKFSVNALFLLFFHTAVDGKPEPYAGERIRQIGEVDVLREAVFPFLDSLGKRGFRHAEAHDALVEDVREGVARLDVRKDLRKGGKRFIGNSRKGIQGRRMPESLFGKTENHDGGRPFPVRNHFAGIRNQGLRPVDVQQVQSPAMEDRADDGQLLCALHISLAAGNLCQSSLRDVVLGRSEPSCRNHNVVLTKFAQQVAGDFSMLVAERKHARYPHTDLFQRGGDVGRIGVDDLTDQDFITDRAYGSLRHANSVLLCSFFFRCRET